MKIPLAKLWGLTTPIVFVAAYFYLCSFRGYGVRWALLFYLLYICASFIIFYSRVMGEVCGYLQLIGRVDQAEQLAIKLCKKGNQSVPALNIYGVYLLKNNQPEQALPHFTQAKKMNDNAAADKYLTTSIASCYWLMGRYKKGITVLQDLIGRYDFINEDIYTTLGYLYILDGDYDNAQKYSLKALEVKENHAPAYDNLGRIYYDKADKALAEENFLKAVAIYPYMADSLYYLGLIEQDRGEIEKATAYYLKAQQYHLNALNTVSKEMIDQKVASTNTAPDI